MPDQDKKKPKQPEKPDPKAASKKGAKSSLKKMNKALAEAEKAKKALEKLGPAKKGGKKGKKAREEAKRKLRGKLKEAADAKMRFIAHLSNLQDDVFFLPFWWWYKELKSIDQSIEDAIDDLVAGDLGKVGRRIAKAKRKKEAIEKLIGG